MTVLTQEEERVGAGRREVLNASFRVELALLDSRQQWRGGHRTFKY